MAQQQTTEFTSVTSPVTLRSVLLSLALMVPNAYWVTQMELVRYAGHPTNLAPFANVIFIIVVLLALNPLLRLARLKPFSRPELLVVYVMLSIASALCGHDSIQVLAPQIIHPFRYASPENRWEELFFGYLPRWLYVSDSDAIRGAYLGGTSFYLPQHYRPWLQPLLWWSLFIFALLFLMLFINCLFRQRWMEHEKLSYPITALPMEITQPGAGIFKSKLFWWGFGVSGLVDVINGLNVLSPSFPRFNVRVWHYDAWISSFFTAPPWTALRGMRISFYPFAIGLGLLLPLDLLFSCWFFYWFDRLQRLVGELTGWNRLPRYPWTNQQAFGGYVGIALFSFWMARGYLWDLLKTAWGRGGLSEKEEPVRYRTTFIGLALSLAFLIWFSVRMGMDFWVACVFFAIDILLFTSITRIRAELGPPAHDLHYAGPDETLITILGSRSPYLDARSLTCCKLFYWFNRAYRSLPMPHQLEGMKIARLTGMSLPSLFWTMVLAGIFGTLTAFWAHIHCFYAFGISSKFVGPAITAFGREPFDRIASLLANPVQPDRYGTYAIFGGLGFTFLLMLLRMRFMWFPFHPVGYAISTSWSMNCLWMPLFIAYLLKLGILHLFGYAAFRQFVPFAVGLVMGEFIIGNLWLVYGVARGIQTYAFWP